MAYEFPVFDDMDRIIEQLVSQMDAREKKEMTKKADTFFAARLLRPMRIQLVVDANVIVAAAIEKARGKNQLFFSLLQSPYLSIIAPPEIKSEVMSAIEKRAPKLQIDKLQLEMCANEALGKIRLIEAGNNEFEHAATIMKNRDNKDAPYLALVISEKTQGIVSNDNDLKELADIAQWNIRGIAKVLTRFEHGAFSFSLLAASVPILIELFLQLCGVILAIVTKIVGAIIVGVGLLIKGGVEQLSQLGVLGVILLFSIVFYGKEQIGALIVWVAKTLSDFLRTVYNGLKPIVEFLAAIIAFVSGIINNLYVKVEHTVFLCNQLATNPSDVAKA